MKLDIRETAAVLAGPRLLQRALEDGSLVAGHEELGCILNDDGLFEGMEIAEIDNLCDRLNG